MTGEPPIDLEALLVALVLAPATFSRNRFFSLYADAAARRVRRRAAMVRSIVRQLASGAEGAVLTPVERGGTLLSFIVPALGLKRTAALDTLELAVVRFAVARAAIPPVDAGGCPDNTPGRAATPPAALVPEPGDAAMIERALARLLPEGSMLDAADASAGGAHDEADAPTEPFPPRGLARHDTQAP